MKKASSANTGAKSRWQNLARFFLGTESDLIASADEVVNGSGSTPGSVVDARRRNDGSCMSEGARAGITKQERKNQEHLDAWRFADAIHEAALVRLG